MCEPNKRFRPANAKECEHLLDIWCGDCLKGEDCETALMVIIVPDVDDPEYPKEWVYGEDGKPMCTARQV